MLLGQESDLAPEIEQIERGLHHVRLQVGCLSSRLAKPWWQGLMSPGKRQHSRSQLARFQTLERQLVEALSHCRDPALCSLPRAIPPHVIPPLKAIPPTVILAAGQDPEAFRTSLSSHLRFTQKRSPIWVLTSPSCPETSRLAEAAVRSCLGRLSCLTSKPEDLPTDVLNRAFLKARGDVILASPSVRVSGRWLQQLRDAAHSAPEIALCVPIASLLSDELWDELALTSPLGLGFGDLHSIWQLVAASPPPAPVIPPAPPCLYIRRDALAAIGFLSTPSNAGETPPLADLARRATDAGWWMGTSAAPFAIQLPTSPSPRSAPMPDGRPVTGRPAPAKKDATASGGSLAPWALALRQRAAIHHNTQFQSPSLSPHEGSPPGLLFIVFKGGGGTPQTNWDLALSLSRQLRCFLLEVDSDQWLTWQVHEGEKTPVGSIAFPTLMGWDLPPDPRRARALRQLVGDLHIGLIHLRHFLGLYPELVGELSALGIPVIVSIHDFYTICPNAHLIDASQQYCAGDCTLNIAAPSNHADCEAVSLDPAPMTTARLRPTGALAWRDRTGVALQQAVALVTTSPFAADLLGKFFPFLRGQVEVIEHGRDLPWHPPTTPPEWPPPGGLKLAVVGHITAIKGGPLLAELGTLARTRLPQAEWHFVGTVADPAFRPHGSTDHGRYNRDDLPAILRSISPHLILIPSLMIETFSHVLTEAWAAGIPVIANDRGALGERIRRLGGGWLAPQPLAERWLDLLSTISADPEGYAASLAEIAAMEPRTIAHMADDYAALYARVSTIDVGQDTSSSAPRPRTDQ